MQLGKERDVSDDRLNVLSLAVQKPDSRLEYDVKFQFDESSRDASDRFRRAHRGIL